MEEKGHMKKVQRKMMFSVCGSLSHWLPSSPLSRLDNHRRWIDCHRQCRWRIEETDSVSADCRVQGYRSLSFITPGLNRAASYIRVFSHPNLQAFFADLRV